MSDPAENLAQTVGEPPTPEEKRNRPVSSIMKISGQDYLRVADRVVWFREEYPDGTIDTELLEHEQGKYAVFKATVANTKMGRATGYGSETFTDFKDYLEKAEAKALGRALGNLGYGTASALADDGADHDRVVDAPVQRSGNTVAGQGQGNQANAHVTNPDRPATERQRKFITDLGMDVRASDAFIADELKTRYRTTLASITAGDASDYINILQERKRTKWTPEQSPQAIVPDDEYILEDADDTAYPAGPSLSKMGWPDIANELLLPFPVADQIVHWKTECAKAAEGKNRSEMGANVKAMCALAGDAVKLVGPSQSWRFVHLINAIPIGYADMIDSIVRVADEKAGLKDNPAIHDAARGRAAKDDAAAS